MQAIEAAILKTVLYADVFNFPMTPDEIYHFLIADQPVNPHLIQQTLKTSSLLQALLCGANGYIALRERKELIALRTERDEFAQQLWPLAVQYGRWLARLPFVRMVALTGAMAMHNPNSLQDDLDYLIITTPGRVWLARGFAVLVVRLVKRRGVIICPNYVLALDALAQTRRDLFIAHEVVQMIPIYGETVYAQLRAENDWVLEQMPNAKHTFRQIEPPALGAGWGLLKRLVEGLLHGRLGNMLESWEHRRKLRRFAPQIETPQSAALLDSSQVKGHFNDHGRRILASYEERLRQYGLTNKAILPATGD